MVDLMLWLKHCHTHVFPGDNGLSNVVDDALPYLCFPQEIMVDLMLWLKHCHTHVFPRR